MKHKKIIFRSEVILFLVIIFLLIPYKKVFADVIAKQDQHNGQISGLLKTGSYNIQTLGSGLSGFLESVQLWAIRYGNPSTISVQILCYNESSYSTTCANSSTSTSASVSTSPSQITLTGFYYQLDPTKYYMIKANVNDATNQTIIYGVGSGNLWPNGNCWYPQSCQANNSVDYYFILNSGIKVTPTPTVIPTPDFVIAQQIFHNGEISGALGTGSWRMQQLGNGLTGFATTLKLWTNYYTTPGTIAAQILCYTEATYTTTCAPSSISPYVNVLRNQEVTLTGLNILLDPSNYYAIKVYLNGGLQVTIDGPASGDLYRCINNPLNTYGLCNFWYPPTGQVSEGSDLYFRLKSSAPTPTPTPSASPTPAPFLDLPYNYKSKNKSFEQVALNPESWFDHAYPLADLYCCTQSIVRYDSFGERVMDAYEHHNGYDYSEYRNGATRNAPVLAAASGSATIILENSSGGYGNLVKIDHPNGYQTWYGHLSDTGLLQVDQDGKKQVEKGEKIGEVGNTGHSTGYHIHFTVLKDTNENGTFDDDDNFGKPYGFVDPLGWKEEDENGIKHADPWTEWTKDGRTGAVSYNLFTQRTPSIPQEIIKGEGGEINTDKVKIIIPQNALPVNASIKIEKTAFDSSDIEGNIFTSIVPSLILTAKSLTGDLIKFFSLPLQITYDYKEAGLTNIVIDSIQLYFYNEETNKWEPLPTIIHDKINKILTAQTSHFSRFALMGKAKDTIAPVTKITINDNSEPKKWYNNTSVTIKLLPEDNHENSIGIADTLYSTNYTEDNNNWNDYVGSIEFNNEGNYSLRYFSVDNGDNKEEQKTLNFGIDQTPPVTTAKITGTKGNNDWYVSDVSVELTASDEASGISGTKYSLDNGQTYQEYASPITIQTEGINKFLYYSEDNAGNKENAKEMEIKIDKTPPDTLLSLSWTKGTNDWYGSDVLVSFNSTDNTSGSPITFYKLDDENNFTEYLDTIEVEKEGTTTITYYSTDEAGNKEAPKIKVIKIDQTPPIVSISASPDSIWPPNGKMVNVKITGNGSDSHLKTTTFNVEDEYNQIQPPLSYFDQTIQLEAKRNGDDLDGRTYTILTTAEDLAGNTTQATATVTIPHDQRK